MIHQIRQLAQQRRVAIREQLRDNPQNPDRKSLESEHTALQGLDHTLGKLGDSTLMHIAEAAIISSGYKRAEYHLHLFRKLFRQNVNGSAELSTDSQEAVS